MSNYNSTLQSNNIALQAILNMINELPEAGSGTGGSTDGGIDTSDATATNTEIFEGKTAYVNNAKVTGTFTINNELSEQEQLLTELDGLLNMKASSQETWVLTLMDGSTVEKVVSLI